MRAVVRVGKRRSEREGKGGGQVSAWVFLRQHLLWALLMKNDFDVLHVGLEKRGKFGRCWEMLGEVVCILT